jgi:hypothetical protein
MGQQVAATPATNPREMKKMETDIEKLAEEYKELQTARQHLEDDIIRYLFFSVSNMSASKSTGMLARHLSLQ